MNNIFALLSGLIFGIGLIVAGMANPAKVLGFLDLAGLWDPSLALVMGGAIAVGSVAFAIAKRKTKSFLGLPIQLPTISQIDRRLIVGSLLFGMGWGLAGICPYPIGRLYRRVRHQLADVLRPFGDRLAADLALGRGRSVRRPVTYLWRTLAISV